VHAARHEGAERARVELVAGDLPLRAPGLSVGVEDAPAEEVVQKQREPGPLGVAVEAGAQEVLHVRRVGGDRAPHAARPAQHEGARGLALEELGHPVEHAVPVSQELWQVPDQRVRLQPRRVRRPCLPRLADDTSSSPCTKNKDCTSDEQQQQPESSHGESQRLCSVSAWLWLVPTGENIWGCRAVCAAWKAPWPRARILFAARRCGPCRCSTWPWSLPTGGENFSKPFPDGRLVIGLNRPRLFAAE